MKKENRNEIISQYDFCVIGSNHGNHTGYNRKWEHIRFAHTYEDAQSILRDWIMNFDECAEYDEENDIFVYQGENINFITSYENDLKYHYVISRDDYIRGIFDGGHMGYAPSKIEEEWGKL
jgi:hypothetical protein